MRDELVLAAPHASGDDSSSRALALNRSGRAIWALCDGSRTVDAIVATLARTYASDPDELSQHVHDVLADLSAAGLLTGCVAQARDRTATTFVIGIEDKPYFWWQTAIFLESVRGRLPAGWRVLVIVCNTGAPVSAELRRILDRYEADFATGTNYADAHPVEIGPAGAECHAALNRVEALSVAADLVDGEDIICLLDSDTFLFGDINPAIMPVTCAAPRNWHIDQEVFFSTVGKNAGKGVNLTLLLRSIGCAADFRPGGVNVFVTAEVARNRKYIADCFRFARALYLLGRIAGAGVVWMAEMPCFTLAMTANGIAYDLLECDELRVSSCIEPVIPSGTLYHYYRDPGDVGIRGVGGNGAFRGSDWHKQAYREVNFLRTDFADFASRAQTAHERWFFKLAADARRRLYG